MFKLLRALEAATGLTSPGMARIDVLVVVMPVVVEEKVPICICLVVVVVALVVVALVVVALVVVIVMVVDVLVEVVDVITNYKN